MKMRFAVCAAAIASFTLGVAAAQQTLEGQPPPGEQRGTGLRNVILGPNDAVDIYVLDAEELSRTWRVGEEGDLNLPMVGRMMAKGMTVEQFERDLGEKLKAFIRNPQVYVTVSEVKSAPVTVIGPVERPGTIQIEGRKTLLQVLMEAGGPKNAGPTVTVTRKAEMGRIPVTGARETSDGKYSVVELNLEEVLEGRSEGANLVVRAHDVITVAPQPRLQKLVHVIGEVHKPGAVELVQQETVTVTQLLAAAGGWLRTAKPGKAVIMHVNPDGARTEIASIDLRKVVEGKVKDLELIPGDILVVPSSAIKTYLDLGGRSVAAGAVHVLTRY